MDKEKWDGVTNFEGVVAELLYFIGNEKKRALQMSYGDFGNLLRKRFKHSGKGCMPEHYVFADSNTINVHMHDIGVTYEITWNKAAKALHKYLTAQKNKEDDKNMGEIIVSENYTKAVALSQRIIANAQAAQMSLFEMCKGLKDMHDSKLYKELGYGSFEDYCEKEVGVSRFMAYKYIKVGGNVESIQQFEHIGVTRLSLLCDLSEEQRTEIMQNTDVSDVSVRELKAEIEKLKQSASESEKLLAESNAEIERQKDLRMAVVEKVKEVQREKNGLIEQVNELKKKSADTIVIDKTAEIEQLNSQIDSLKKQLAEKPAVQMALPEMSDAEKEVAAFQKVADNSLHNLFTAICRQNLAKKPLGRKAIAMLEKYRELFEFSEQEE